jgi:hypothetical protein
MSFKRTIL